MGPQAIDRVEIERCRDKILASKGFQMSPQLSAFLAFVTGEALEGNAGAIKAYTIAVEALGKPESFDPQLDPAVRVLAGRLRQALQLYYSESGAADPVRIEIKRGSYVPNFAKQGNRSNSQAASDAQEVPHFMSQTVTKRIFSVRRLIPGLIAVILGLLALNLWRFPPWEAERVSDQKQYQNRTADLAVLPTISVSVVSPGSGQMPDWHSSSELASAFDMVLHGFDDLELLGVAEQSSSLDFRTLTGDYHYTVSAEPRGDSVRFFGRLIRLRDHTVIWSRDRLSGRPADMAKRNVPELLGAELASLFSPNGVIFADIRRQTGLPDSLRCLIGAYAYFAARTPEGHASSLACAKRLMDAGSTSPSMNAALTFLILDIYRAGYAGLGEPPLPAAYRYAIRGLNHAPSSARAHQAMFAYYKVAGDHINAGLSGEKAVSLNPADLDILADYGSYLVARGTFAQAMPIMLNVEQLALTKPDWFNFHLFIGAHFSGNEAMASRAAGRFVDHNSVLADIVRALTALESGDLDAARRAVDSLVQTEPGFAKSPKERLIRRGFEDSFATTIASMLMDAGLQIAAY